MPRIPVYEQRTNAPGPVGGARATAESFGGGAAAGMEYFGRSLENAGGELNQIQNKAWALEQQRRAQAETSALAAGMAKARADFTVGLQQAAQNADPHDRNFADNFLKQSQDSIAKLGEGLTTDESRNAYTRESASLQGDLQTRAFMAQAQMAGAAAVIDHTDRISSLSNAVMADPTQLNSVITSLDQTRPIGFDINEWEKQKLKDKRELAVAAANGLIQDNPQIALQRIQSGELDSYVDAATSKELINAAKTGINAERIETERKIAEAKRAQADAREKELNGLMGPLFDNKLTPQDVLKSGQSPEMKWRMMDFIEKQNKGAIQPNETLVQQLLDRQILPDGDPDKLNNLDQLVPFYRQVGEDRFNFLKGQMIAQRKPDTKAFGDAKRSFIDSFRGSITKTSISARDAEGDIRFGQFRIFIDQKIDQAVQDGASWKDLFNPKAKDYLGDYATAFMRTGEQAITGMTTGMSEKPNPRAIGAAIQSDMPPGFNESGKPVKGRQPGESPESYIARMKGK